MNQKRIQILFSNRGYLLLYDTIQKQYIFDRLGNKTTYDNPIHAWNDYSQSLDIYMRKVIGDKLEKEGKNRYTGLPEEKLNLAETAC